MEFTPEPDMFHDIFGHLPYLTMEFYARIEDKFAPAYLKATPDEREVIKRLAWYSTEFGLVVEDNHFKVFGAVPLTMIFAMMQMPLTKRYQLEPATLEVSDAREGDIGKG